MIPFPVILSAPSGGGKTTIARHLMERRSDVGYSVSCTTRPPRAGEVDGRDYHFLATGEFIAARERGEFAESAEVHGRLYGTLRREVRRVLGSGKHVIMDIDVQGAEQFVRAFPDSVTIFLLPPSGEVLLQRLTARKTEDAASLRQRLESAMHELRQVRHYQYVVVNDELDGAIGRVSAVIDAETARGSRTEGLDGRVTSLVSRLERELGRL